MSRRAWLMLIIVVASGAASMASALAVDGLAAAAEWSIHTVQAKSEAGTILIEAGEVLAGEDRPESLTAAIATFKATTKDNPVQLKLSARIVDAASAVAESVPGSYSRLRDVVDDARAEEDRLMTIRINAFRLATERAAFVAWSAVIVAVASLSLVCLVRRPRT